jgi:L-threonylcarbamoyladenylate synthase
MKVAITDPALPSRLTQVLADEGVVVMPCDTIYGIVGIAPASEARIRAIKGREQKSFLQLIVSAEWLNRFSDLELPEALTALWPGPLTLILPARSSPATVALRVPDDSLLRELMQELDRPLFSTSVNRSGEQPLWRIADIAEAFESSVDLLVDAGDLQDRLPSTILDVTSRPYRILRQGALEVPPALLEAQ